MPIGKWANFIEYIIRARVIYPLSSTRRYRVLLDIVFENRINTILEIGVYTGRRALELIKTAGICYHSKDVTYLGFDLFEELNDEILKDQLSKKPDTMNAVCHKIEKTGANVFLFKGFSEETLPQLILKKDDYPPLGLVFIDGGHSIATISSDWENVRKLLSENTIVVFDDYYVDCPTLTDRFGCNAVIDTLDRTLYDVEFIEIVDSFDQDWGKLNVQMVKVTLRKDR
jgi:hypothetical protein